MKSLKIIFSLIILATVIFSCNKKTASVMKENVNTEEKMEESPVMDESVETTTNKVEEEEIETVKEIPTPKRPTELPAENMIIASFQKTPCFGKCPAFKATIYKNGLVLYEGQRHVEYVGEHYNYISLEKTKELIAKAKALGFHKLGDNYPEDPSLRVMDLPSTITNIKINDELKMVNNNNQAPESLTELETYIEEILENLNWYKL